MGDKPSVKSKFSVSLKDHNIEVPSLMFQKISEMIKLEVDFMLKFVK
jgi:riboflavin synthase alpha subunit